MRPRFGPFFSVAAFCLLTVLVAASPVAAQIAKIENGGDQLVFHPIVEADTWTLTVAGPCNFRYESTVKEGGLSAFRLGRETIDGRYKFSLAAIRAIAPDVFKILRKARATGDNTAVSELCREGRLPEPSSTQSGSFAVVKGKIVYDPTPESQRKSDFDEEAQAAVSPEASADAAGASSSAAAFQIAATTASNAQPPAATCDWAWVEPGAGTNGR